MTCDHKVGNHKSVFLVLHHKVQWGRVPDRNIRFLKGIDTWTGLRDRLVNSADMS